MKKIIMVLAVLVCGPSANSNESKSVFQKIKSGVYNIQNNRGPTDCQFLIEKSTASDSLTMTLVSNQTTKNYCEGLLYSESYYDSLGSEGFGFNARCNNNGTSCFAVKVIMDYNMFTGFKLTLLDSGTLILENYSCDGAYDRSCDDESRYINNKNNITMRLQFVTAGYSDVIAENFYSAIWDNSKPTLAENCAVAKEKASNSALRQCLHYRGGHVYKKCTAVITKSYPYSGLTSCAAEAKASPN